MFLTKRLPRETGRDYALRILKDNIVRLELKPGSMVSENELAAELGLSRTPVREALIELSKVKIVEIYPQKGSAVALIDYKLVEEAQFMRNNLECAVAELDCKVSSMEDVVKLRENLNLQQYYIKGEVQDATFLDLDNQFHRMLFDIAEKPQVYVLMQSIEIHFDRVRNLTLQDIKTSNVVRDHEQLLDAIADRNAEAARTVMQKHLSRFRVVEKQVREKFPAYFK
jgi:DNA-binding GntR family transcriptional regulator